MRSVVHISLLHAVLLSSKCIASALNTLSKTENSVHVPIGKDGEGEYTAATKGCFDVIDAATPLVVEEIMKQPMRPFGSGSPAFHIADYGTADAGTSLGLLSKMTTAHRERVSDDKKEIVIHYEDQVTNEWQSVFNHVLGIKSVSDAYGNSIETPYALGNVYAEASGVGFHSQCYSSNSIDFGISFTAMHWLSAFPSSLRGTEYMHSARCSTPPQAEEKQAASDWSSILKARAKELVPGGRFVCVNFCKSSDGYFLGQTDTGESMWDSFQTAWNMLKTQDLINEDERLGVSFPNYYRTKEEFLASIDDVPELKLISIEERIVKCPYRELYLKGDTGLSAREYAEWFVPTTKTWSHSTFRNALKSERDDKEEVLSQFWENYMSIVAKKPENHGMDYVHAYLVLEKRQL